MEPRIIDNFKLVDNLGEGGMGEVYLGIDMMLEREVAVKVLRPELMSRQDIVERFRSEAVALAKLNHSNIATLYSFLKWEKQFFMVMEYVPGETLENRIRRQEPMHWKEAAALVCQILKGLDHAHQMGIVHRDIKPANIILTPDGVPKLTDFGIARILQTARLTQVGQMIGTLEYISPEQVAGKETDSRSDLYSLGAVFYEMLTAHLPFRKNTDYELIKAQIEESPRAPGKFVSDIPARIEKLVLRMLHKKPERRFPSADACREELEQLLNSFSPIGKVPAFKSALPFIRPRWNRSLGLIYLTSTVKSCVSFIQSWWGKYPGVVILIAAGCIAVFILLIVLMDSFSKPKTASFSQPFNKQQSLTQEKEQEMKSDSPSASKPMRRTASPRPASPVVPPVISKPKVSPDPPPVTRKEKKPVAPSKNGQKGWSIQK